MSSSKEIATSGSCLMCTMGVAPSVPLTAMPPPIVFVDGKPVLTELDLPSLPLFPGFGACKAKPIMGVPGPCVPSPIKWLLTTKEMSQATVNGLGILLKSSTIVCAQGGNISIIPGP